MRRLQSAAAAVVFGGGAVLLVLGSCGKVPTVGNPGSVLSMFANPTSVPLSGTSTLTISAFTAAGQPLPDGTVINLTTTLGTVPASVKATGGFAQATFAGGTTPGEAEVTARSGVATPATVKVRVGAVGGSVVLAANPASLPLGGGSATITATVRDTGGSPVAGASVVFSTDKGTLGSGGSPVTSGADGTARDVLTTTAAAVVTARVTAAGTGTPITGSVNVTVAGSGAAALTVTASPASLPPGGGQVALTAAAADANSRPVVGLSVVFSASAGRIGVVGPLTTDAAGEVHNTLDTTVTAEVTATAPGVSGRVSVPVGRPTPGVLVVDLVSVPSGIFAVSATPTPVAACAPSGFDITLTATVTSGGNPVEGAQVVFASAPAASRARVRGRFCESPPQVLTDAAGVAEVHYTFTDAELLFCSTISVPCAFAACPSPFPTPTCLPSPTPTATVVTASNDCCCGLRFTATVGSSSDNTVLVVLAETSCPTKQCACRF